MFFIKIFNTDNCELIQRFFSQEDELIHDKVLSMITSNFSPEFGAFEHYWNTS